MTRPGPPHPPARSPVSARPPHRRFRDGGRENRSSRLLRSLTSGVGQTEATPAPRARARALTASAVTGAVIVATSPAEGGGAAAAQVFQGSALLRRLVDQLASLGIRDVLVLTRPEFEADLAPQLAGAGDAVRLQVSAGAVEDLRAIAARTRESAGALVVVQ